MPNSSCTLVTIYNNNNKKKIEQTAHGNLWSKTDSFNQLEMALTLFMTSSNKQAPVVHLPLKSVKVRKGTSDQLREGRGGCKMPTTFKRPCQLRSHCICLLVFSPVMAPGTFSSVAMVKMVLSSHPDTMVQGQRLLSTPSRTGRPISGEMSSPTICAVL